MCSSDLASALSQCASLSQLHWHDGAVHVVRYDPSHRRLVSAGEDAVAVLHNAETGAVVARIPHPAPIDDACFSPDGALLATACRDGSVQVRRLDSSSGVPAVWRHQ